MEHQTELSLNETRKTDGMSDTKWESNLSAARLSRISRASRATVSV